MHVHVNSYIIIICCIFLNDQLNPLAADPPNSIPADNPRRIQKFSLFSTFPSIAKSILAPLKWITQKKSKISKIIPKDFDARNKWKMCTIIRESMLYHKQLEYAWATVTSSALADRICIAQDGEFNEHLSLEELVTCCTNCGTSNSYMGKILKAWEYYRDFGGLSEPHFDYYGVCPPGRSRFDDSKFRRKITNVYTLNTIEEIKNDILTYGPVSATLRMYRDSQDHIQSGVYVYDRRTTTENFQLHFVKVIGWGTEDNIPYWLCLTIYGDYWKAGQTIKINVGPSDPNFGGTVIAGQLSNIRKNYSNASTLLNTQILPIVQDSSLINNIQIPSEFDARDHWKMCTIIGEITVIDIYYETRWAVVTSSAHADRLCIASGGEFNEHLSVDELLTCCRDCRFTDMDASDMSKIEKAWEYYRNFGGFSERHFKYYDVCPPENSTIDDSKFRRKARNVYTLSHIDEIKKDIFTYGPVSAVMNIFGSDGNYYDKSHYDRQSYELHSFKIIGWGNRADGPYWKFLESNGQAYWARAGTLTYNMGNNHRYIEGIVIAGKM